MRPLRPFVRPAVRATRLLTQWPCRSYGKLNEIWFDGGISQRISTRIVALLNKYQPDAVTYGAGIGNNPNDVDWVGTETGEPVYPVWSTGCGKPGGGSRGVPPQQATNFCPKGSDCTLQAPDVWFWMPNTPSKCCHALADPHALWELRLDDPTFFCLCSQATFGASDNVPRLCGLQLGHGVGFCD